LKVLPDIGILLRVTDFGAFKNFNCSTILYTSATSDDNWSAPRIPK